MIQPVILAGGTGTRMWPMSRELYPKQFLSLTSDNTMFEETLLRLEGLECLDPIVVCNEDHRFVAAEQLRSVGKDHGGILLEPIGRNTAPAIALATLFAQNRKNMDPLILVLPADHMISDAKSFNDSVFKAVPFAESGKLVTFGVKPQSPETGYGYIKKGNSLNSEDVCAVDKFVEKPCLALATEYLDSGDYFWNSGMFLFRASSFIKEMHKFCNDILAASKETISLAKRDLDFVRFDIDSFKKCRAESIDYAVMEKTELAVVVPLDSSWNDLGSWSSVWELTPKDRDGNVSKGDVISIDSNNNYVQSDNKLVATLGVSDLVVIDTKDALLVADKARVQDVKCVVNELKDLGRPEYKVHRDVYRPWGKYDTICQGKRDLVKRITVQPGQKVSTQMHHHRAEHWIVVSGTAKVTKGEVSFLLGEDESTYIPLGVIHTLENPGIVPLEMIEVQTGSYLDEKDILRFENKT
ncbi:mannose-1-phosphate guanylyltransferase/mannose-6-phosphate isomerase [Vibrio sp. La 4.2.2]|uniref:mannose-1-phosphate guanylyltransferase/mannose-6-phosphate isomerase n=1 Tax=Vibrio sp. La 4.2.2 TaxID=2998830 RepID=UPI0022CDD06A|nr:mannose-1-phosphate guanylyltransferase/mannose-6-phosphate isomerase [Vibrio sp. La 4.2.2]MDA0110524.1 mannose-1-phosphate guanylyltransferase/mannose-6-phosphate isomerase [Vibrio sp. La 4.2.2]